MKACQAAEAIAVIRPNSHIFVQSVAAAPQHLLKALCEAATTLQNIHLYHLHTEGAAPYAEPQYASVFHVHNFFVGANVRKAVQEGRADYIPVFLSEIPSLFHKKIIPLDVALIQVSPPDKHGYCSLGVSVDISAAAVKNSNIVIAQINPNMPRTHGDGLIHESDIDYGVYVNEPLPECLIPAPNEIEMRIGSHVASLVENGATLQMGIGAIPNAVLAALGNHKDLGIHTEMFADGVMNLVQEGVITGAQKRTHPGKIVAGFVMGSKQLYSFVDDNPMVSLLDIGYVNDTAVIRRNPKVTAINSALEIDLFGQVCADSIGSLQYSGVGGQMDFIRGASLSEGGKPIIALPSVTNKGMSKIVSSLKPGASVTTTRAHVHYVVTEYGIANLYAKNLKQRARAIIEIAHPDARAQLERDAHQILGAF